MTDLWGPMGLRAPDIEIVEAFLAEVPRRMVFDNAAEDVR